MRTTFFQLFYLLTIGMLIISACNLPSSTSPSEIVPLADQPTKIATATIELTATQIEVVFTQTSTATATETPTPEPSATPTPEIVKAEVVRESNCRIGPAGNYDLVAKYQVGQLLEVVANDLGAGYIFVKNFKEPEEPCYLLTQNIKISGDTSILPKFTPLPSPTTPPYFNVSFKKFDTCKGDDYALFTVENTGSVPFRSVYIRVADPKVDKSVEQSLNVFDLWTGCIIAKAITPLEAGMTGYIVSPRFKWAARGNKLQTVIMLCTEKDLKGICVNQIVEVKE